MKQRITPLQLVTALAQKEHVTKKKAEAFLRAFFEVVEKALREDKTVKIKNFGTFKVTAVSERESVNIQTGERFQIDSHTKISFVPDNYFKEKVNKPFSHFQTVVLAADLDEELLDKAVPAEPSVADVPEPIEEPQPLNVELSEPPATPAPAPPVEPEPEVSAEEPPVAPEPQVVNLLEEPIDNDTPTIEPEPTPTEEENNTTTHEDETNMTTEYSNSNKRLKITALLLFFVVSLIGAYLAGYYNVLKINLPRNNAPASAVVEEVPAVLADTLAAAADSVALSNEELAKQYPQLPNADFMIIGELEPHVLQKGEGLYMLAKKVYGDKEFARYIIFFNNLKNPDNVPVGATLKMPELRKKKQS